jgi:hypothetical protein
MLFPLVPILMTCYNIDISSVYSQGWLGRSSGISADSVVLIRKVGSCRVDMHRICECSERTSMLFAESEADLLCVEEV